MRKNLLLTMWLLLPFGVVGVIFAVVFMTMGVDRPDKLPPVGAGGGDAGGANAIGLMRSDHAERIDPRAWAPGVRVELDEPSAGETWWAIGVSPAGVADLGRRWRMHGREGALSLELQAAEIEAYVALIVAPEGVFAPGVHLKVELRGPVVLASSSGESLPVVDLRQADPPGAGHRAVLRP